MDRIFEKIYREIICNEAEMYEFGRKMENEVSEIMAAYRDKMSEEELERMTERIDDIVSSARQDGFYFGMRFAVRALVWLKYDKWNKKCKSGKIIEIGNGLC
ncbi:hypothetical protein C823_001307 [Eubacterium plexicaudatum ASF492]|nr:hypothetical protein C823_001307 [Eubacterium plexicaudatum ASF492]